LNWKFHDISREFQKDSMDGNNCHLKNMRCPIMNVVANMDDLKDYVAGTSDIFLES
jgi:hypothetical protein